MTTTVKVCLPRAWKRQDQGPRAGNTISSSVQMVWAIASQGGRNQCVAPAAMTHLLREWGFPDSACPDQLQFSSFLIAIFDHLTLGYGQNVIETAKAGSNRHLRHQKEKTKMGE